jgi:hypothetical protein
MDKDQVQTPPLGQVLLLLFLIKLSMSNLTLYAVSIGHNIVILMVGYFADFILMILLLVGMMTVVGFVDRKTYLNFVRSCFF